jgi:hypothetical protein
MSTTTSFWINNPTILLNKNDITHIWPTKQMNVEEKLNSITRLVVILTFLGYLITGKMKIVLTGLITIAALIFLYKVQQRQSVSSKKLKKITEGFANPNTYKMLDKNFTEPTNTNPIMNVLMNEYTDDPERKEAAPSFNPIVEKDINDKTIQFVINNQTKDNDNNDNYKDKNDINDKLFKDLGDNFQFDQSMRSWYATPNTTIPNDQKSFADYCYGGMISCKENNEFACMRNAPPQWMNG